MPRRPRIDAPGAVHHVFVRGLARHDLFLDDDDRERYLDRLALVAVEEGARCLAWALLTNHVHLVVRSGPSPLAVVMHRVGTAYGLYFNTRHGRAGYVFQGRYGARRVDDDADLLGLVRYVHRNPIAAGVVRSLAELEHYPWTGYGALSGRTEAPAFQCVGEVLALFGSSPGVARHRLRAWMQLPTPPAAAGSRDGLDALIAAVCAELGASQDGVRNGRRTRPEAEARAAIARRAARELGLGAPEIARALGVSRQALWARLRGGGRGAG